MQPPPRRRRAPCRTTQRRATRCAAAGVRRKGTARGAGEYGWDRCEAGGAERVGPRWARRGVAEGEADAPRGGRTRARGAPEAPAAQKGSVVGHVRRRVRRPRVVVVAPPSLALVLARRVRKAEPVRLREADAARRAAHPAPGEPSSSSAGHTEPVVARSPTAAHARAVDAREEVLREGRRRVRRACDAATAAALHRRGVPADLTEGRQAGRVGRLGPDRLGVRGDGADGVVRPVVARVEARGQPVHTAAAAAAAAAAERGARPAATGAEHIARVVVEAVHVRVAVVGAAGLAELDHRRLEVVERALDETLLLLVVREEVVPQRVLHRQGGAGAQQGVSKQSLLLESAWERGEGAAPCSRPWGCPRSQGRTLHA
ncbi:hypothetical protein DMC30DRAFT_194727 [Rhodotorula diobovata]|uniref:Uncharacterized protein n=1 Tax=Rhodotorula diobovata TaxID=5288 RepID=A0A5C5FZ74_9BASI|nr:hypothetical protein DMC30DRAFT_194727 [Rhodotorula diobovata]